MKTTKNHPNNCEKHGFVSRVTADGVISIPKEDCPVCRADAAEAALVEVRRERDQGGARW